ncbi:hypothetical protein [Puia sp.]|jgi:hypothetical protein|uniref:hypothetical protein n=1 Tax=Puia sp. TaxID=2045100 RepID=UPI002F411B38
MARRIIIFFLPLFIGLAAHSQQSPTGAALPSPEEFLNAVYTTVVDSAFPHYYLVMGTDSCRFVRYEYDEWIKYHLKEPLSFNILNELSEKVYLSRYPYFWKQARLDKAVCITRKQADSLLEDKKDVVFSFSLPQFTDDGQYAVIDLNVLCGPLCGQGFTCIYRLTTRGEWKLVGRSLNFSSY